MAKSMVFKGAGGFIVKHCGDYFRVPKAFAKGLDNVDDVAAKVAKHLDDVPTWPKGKLRKPYLGDTPGKLTETGQKVWKRMAKADPPQLFDELGDAIDPEDFMDDAGKLRNLDRGDLDRIYVLDEAGQHRPLSECDMGHQPVDAVDYWTETGYARTPDENAAWMHDPKNYMFEYGPDNQRNGRAQTNRYSNADPVNGVPIPGT